jgi:hypothetical protein
MGWIRNHHHWDLTIEHFLPHGKPTLGELLSQVGLAKRRTIAAFLFSANGLSV